MSASTRAFDSAQGERTFPGMDFRSGSGVTGGAGWDGGGKGVVESDVKGQVLDPSRSLGMTM